VKATLLVHSMGLWSEATKVLHLAQLLVKMWEAEKAVAWAIRLGVGWGQLKGEALEVTWVASLVSSSAVGWVRDWVLAWVESLA